MGIDLEIYIPKCREVVYSDTSGRPFPDIGKIHWRVLTERYLLDESAPVRRQIPYYIFKQIFIQDTPEDVSEPGQEEIDSTVATNPLLNV